MYRFSHMNIIHTLIKWLYQFVVLPVEKKTSSWSPSYPTLGLFHFSPSGMCISLRYLHCAVANAVGNFCMFVCIWIFSLVKSLHKSFPHLWCCMPFFLLTGSNYIYSLDKSPFCFAFHFMCCN